MMKNLSYHPPLVVHNILRRELIGSRVIHIINNSYLFLAFKALSLRPEVFHVDHCPVHSI